MSQSPKIKIEEFLKKLFEIMGFTADFSVEEKDGTLIVDIQSEDAPSLIGAHGANLEALQHLLRAIVSQEGRIGLFLNIGEYRQKKEEHIKNIALAAGARVRTTKQAETLEPMSAWERRVAHTALGEEFSDLETTSIGEEPNRRIVVKIKD